MTSHLRARGFKNSASGEMRILPQPSDDSMPGGLARAFLNYPLLTVGMLVGISLLIVIGVYLLARSGWPSVYQSTTAETIGALATVWSALISTALVFGATITAATIRISLIESKQDREIQFQPLVTLTFASVNDSDDLFSKLSNTEVVIRNVGRGPALYVRVRIWDQQIDYVRDPSNPTQWIQTTFVDGAVPSEDASWELTSVIIPQDDSQVFDVKGDKDHGEISDASETFLVWALYVELTYQDVFGHEYVNVSTI